MLQFDTDETIRDCAECSTQPILRQSRGWFDVYCDTCEAGSSEFLKAGASIVHWNETMYEASGDLDKDVDRDGVY